MTYRAFVPMVYAPRQKRGASLVDAGANTDDVARLGASWWYNWHHNGPIDGRYVPMSFRGSATDIPVEYSGYVLVLNEPENAGQANLTPAQAAARVLAVAQARPDARLIVGGYGYFGREQWPQFVSALGDYRPAGWHVHGYVEASQYWTVTLADVTAWWTTARAQAPGGEFWITEFADTVDGQHAQGLLGFVRGAAWVDRHSWFANRMTGVETWYPPWWTHNPALIDNYGALTHDGARYVQGGAA